MSHKSHYLAKDALPLIYCDNCLHIALEKSERAKRLFDLIVENLRSTEMQAYFSQVQKTLPSPHKSFEILRSESAKQAIEAAKNDEYWSPDIKFFTCFIEKVAKSGLKASLRFWLLRRKAANSRGFSELADLISEFIKAGFNHDPETLAKLNIRLSLPALILWSSDMRLGNTKQPSKTSKGWKMQNGLPERSSLVKTAKP